MGKNKSMIIALLGVLLAIGVFYIFSTSTNNSLSSAANNRGIENNDTEITELNETNEMVENENKDEKNQENEDAENNDKQNKKNTSENSSNEKEGVVDKERERIFFMSDTYFYIDRSNHEDAINFKEGKETEAKEIINYLHETMNEITGHGNVESLNFTSLRDGMYHDTDRFRNGIVKLQEDLLDESRALHDIRNLENYYQLGSSQQTEDRMALRYAHRVIHDLDIYVNGTGDGDDRKIWGVTESYGNDKQIETMYDYLRGREE